MPTTIVVERIPLNKDQKSALELLFASPGYSLLREIINAQCVEQQVASMDAALYGADNELARNKADAHAKLAYGFNVTMDNLDDIQKKLEELATVKLEPRR
jgi:hypothetical protein